MQFAYVGAMLGGDGGFIFLRLFFFSFFFLSNETIDPNGYQMMQITTNQNASKNSLDLLKVSVFDGYAFADKSFAMKRLNERNG